VEIVIGHLQFGRFQFFLFDRQGRNPQPITPPGGAVNTDTIPDIFDVTGSPETLAGCTIWWQCGLASPTGQPGELFSITVRVLQNGKIAGKDGRTGVLAEQPIVEGLIRLQLEGAPS
jgi:hypothetical protein